MKETLTEALTLACEFTGAAHYPPGTGEMRTEPVLTDMLAVWMAQKMVANGYTFEIRGEITEGCGWKARILQTSGQRWHAGHTMREAIVYAIAELALAAREAK